MLQLRTSISGEQAPSSTTRVTELLLYCNYASTCMLQLRISGEQAPSSTTRVTELLDQVITTECSSPLATGWDIETYVSLTTRKGQSHKIQPIL